MKFDENPRYFIIEYYDEKINQIDVRCERNLNEGSLDEEEISNLNELRDELIDAIKSAKENVLNRFELYQEKFHHVKDDEEMRQLKDEIFNSQYCSIFEIKEFITTIFDFKLGVLLFSQFDDDYLQELAEIFEGLDDFEDFDLDELKNLVLFAVFDKLESERAVNVIHLRKGEWENESRIGPYFKVSSLKKVPDQVKSITFLLQNIERIDVDLFYRFTNLKHLSISLQYVNEMSSNCFERLVNLTTLQLFFSGKQLQLPEFLFRGLKSLNELTLEDQDNFCPLSKNHFHGLDNLAVFNLDGGVLDTHCADLFGNFQNLKKLNFSKFELKNKISFSHLNNLEELKIRKLILNKQEEEINHFLLSELVQLNNLTIEFTNEIDDLNSELFVKLFSNPKLERLQFFSTNNKLFEFLHQNKVTFIYLVKHLKINNLSEKNVSDLIILKNRDLFQGLEGLTLRSYQFLDVDPFLYSVGELHNLNVLDVNCLQISNKSFDLLNSSKFSQIRQLVLQFNQRVERPVDEEFLAGLVNLEELSLKYLISSIDPSVKCLFRNMSKLRVLRMQSNEIQVIKRSYFDCLVGLEELEWDANNTRVIEDGAFTNLGKLRTFQLTDSRIEKISSGTFVGLNNLRTLSLFPLSRKTQFGRKCFAQMKQLERINFTNPNI